MLIFTLPATIWKGKGKEERGLADILGKFIMQ